MTCNLEIAISSIKVFADDGTMDQLQFVFEKRGKYGAKMKT